MNVYFILLIILFMISGCSNGVEKEIHENNQLFDHVINNPKIIIIIDALIQIFFQLVLARR